MSLSRDDQGVRRALTTMTGWCEVDDLKPGLYIVTYIPPPGMLLAKGQSATVIIKLMSGVDAWLPQAAIVNAVQIGIYSGYVVTADVPAWANALAKTIGRPPSAHGSRPGLHSDKKTLAVWGSGTGTALGRR